MDHIGAAFYYLGAPGDGRSYPGSILSVDENGSGTRIDLGRVWRTDCTGFEMQSGTITHTGCRSIVNEHVGASLFDPVRATVYEVFVTLSCGC